MLDSGTELAILRRKLIARQGNPAYLSNVESVKARIAELEQETKNA
jgi:hypothetical protein